jgi:3-deoxy-D-manno-octulosonic acid (KDO) 8-phosphate synthase
MTMGRLARRALILGASVSCSTVALAQQAAIPPGDGEILVTARRTEERIQVMSDLRDAFFAEMKVNKEMKRSMDLARRNNRRSIESILHGTGLDDELRAILDTRGAKLEKIFADIQQNIQHSVAARHVDRQS